MSGFFDGTAGSLASPWGGVERLRPARGQKDYDVCAYRTSLKQLTGRAGTLPVKAHSRCQNCQSLSSEPIGALGESLSLTSRGQVDSKTICLQLDNNKEGRLLRKHCVFKAMEGSFH